MFSRPHHQRIAAILRALDADVLRSNGCLFGEGTAIALRYGEYRESVDIDFMVSDLHGYRAMRQLLTGPQGIAPLARNGTAPWVQAQEVRADQYGIRTALRMEGEQRIKFEIVLEGRIAFEAPGPADAICGVATLTPLDMATSKLLANADRWADDGVFSRDLIDLAMMEPARALLLQAITKAESAYGRSIRDSLAKAITQLKNRQGRLERCMQIMQMPLPKAVVWQRIRALARVLPAAAPAK